MPILIYIFIYSYFYFIFFKKLYKLNYPFTTKINISIERVRKAVGNKGGQCANLEIFACFSN